MIISINNNSYNFSHIMPDTDRDESPIRGKMDQESSCPRHSLVDSTINLTPLDHIIRSEQDCESTGPDRYECYSSSPSFGTTNNAIFPVDPSIIRRGVMNDSSLSGPAPYTGMLTVCSGMPLVETGPRSKGGKFLAPPLLTTPRRYNTRSPPGGGIELEGEENAT